MPLLPQQSGLRLIDIGSGGGVPGIPLAIARPDIAVTLVESTRKKAEFLKGVCTHVGATNVKVEALRAEQLHKTAHAGAYDVVTARAVARLSLLVGWTAPFAKQEARLLLIEGQQAEETDVLTCDHCGGRRKILASLRAGNFPITDFGACLNPAAQA